LNIQAAPVSCSLSMLAVHRTSEQKLISRSREKV
jgi:hypothetical protein